MSHLDAAFHVFASWILSYLVFYLYTREMNRWYDDVKRKRK